MNENMVKGSLDGWKVWAVALLLGSVSPGSALAVPLSAPSAVALTEREVKSFVLNGAGTVVYGEGDRNQAADRLLLANPRKPTLLVYPNDAVPGVPFAYFSAFGWTPASNGRDDL